MFIFLFWLKWQNHRQQNFYSLKFYFFMARKCHHVTSQAQWTFISKHVNIFQTFRTTVQWWGHKEHSASSADVFFGYVFLQIANSNPLVSDRQDLSVLQREYAEDDIVYQLKIKVSHTTPAALSHYCTNRMAQLSSVESCPPRAQRYHFTYFFRPCSNLCSACFVAGPIQKVLVHSKDTTRWELLL